MARIEDDEVVYRRVPSTSHWFEPPDQITTANFKLDSRRDEQGISVYRASIVTASQVLQHADALPDSLIAQARVGDIRQLTNAIGNPLELDVLAVGDTHDPGHAEIRGPIPGRLTKAASKALRELFELRQ